MSDKYDLACGWLVKGRSDLAARATWWPIVTGTLPLWTNRPFPRLSQAMTRHDNAQRLLACSLSRTSLILRGSRRRLRHPVSIRINALS